MRIVACLLEKKIDIIIITRTIYQTSKKKLEIGRNFTEEKKRQDIGYDVKIKNLYCWRNIKMYTIILITAFFIVEMSIFYLCNGKDNVIN